MVADFERQIAARQVHVAIGAEGAVQGFIVFYPEGARAIRLYTNEKMARNLSLYPRLGYVETGRVTEDGFRRVYFEKPL